MSLPPPILLLVGGPPAEVEFGPPAPILDTHIRLEIALNDTAYTFSPTWTDFTDVVRGCSWGYRWDAPDGQTSPSELRVTASNRDGRWDAATGLGGATWAGKVRPFLNVRVLASNNGFSTSAQLWRGFLTDIELVTGAQDAEVQLTCTDLLGVLSAIPIEDLERPEELAGDRAEAILTEAGIDAAFINTLDSGTVVMTAATLNGQALGLLQECTRAEGGLFWAGRAGRLNWRDRFYFAELSRSGFTLAGSDIKNVSVPQRLARFSAVERAAVQWAGGEVVADGAATTGWPQVARREMGLPLSYRADAAAMARWLRRVNALSGDQISRVSCDVLRVGDTTVLDGLIGINQLLWLNSANVSLTPVHGHALSGEFWITGETHTVNRNGEWRLDLDLFPVANAWQTDSDAYYEFGQTVTSSLVAGR